MCESTSLKSMYISQPTEIKSAKICPNKRDHLHLPNPPLHPALSRPLSTPIKIDKFQLNLEGYPTRSKQYLLNGFRFGFSIDYVGSRCNFSSKNLLSATNNPKAVDGKLDRGCPGQNSRSI